MNIIWDISNRCNLNCKHCGERQQIDSASSLGKKDILTVAENLSQISTRITLLGGEPLLALAFEDVLDVFSKNNILISLITNGQIYNDYVENLLYRSNIDYIDVSIDGMEKYNDEVRGPGTWKNAINFLHKILERKTPHKTIGVSTVLTKKSIQQIESFLEYFNSLNIDTISFNLLVMTGNALNHKDELYLDDKSTLNALELIASWSKKVNYKININSGSVLVDKYLRNAVGYIHETSPKTCDALFGSGFCDINGYFYPCRSYHGKGIDLKKKIDWNKEYGIFNNLLTTLFCTEAANSPESEMWCPLRGYTENSLSILAKKELETLPKPIYALNQQIFFLETNERFFILFSKSREYVEYTQEGFLIYRLLYKDFPIHKIASETGYSVDVIWNFLDYECLKRRIDVLPQ